MNDWLLRRLNERKEAGLYRSLFIHEQSIKSSHVSKSLIFSSNNYLGLANDHRIIQQIQKTVEDVGVGSTGSRLTTGNSIWHERLEEQIARFKQMEATLLFSSGYLANIGVLSSLPQKGDVILSDQFNHASIIDGCRLSHAETVIYRHCDMNDLEDKLKEIERKKRCFIVTDGVFSMDGTIAPLNGIMEIARLYQAFVIVDDAHATGVLGVNGRGTSEYAGVVPDLVIGTMSKAVGLEGGFVAGSKLTIEYLLNFARPFIFQTALPPIICAAASLAFDLIESEKERRNHLLKHVKWIKTELQKDGFHLIGELTPIIPVIIGDASRAVHFATRLKEKGIIAPAIRPPTVPRGESRIRLTVTASHQRSEIDYMLKAFKDTGKELRIIK